MVSGHQRRGWGGRYLGFRINCECCFRNIETDQIVPRDINDLRTTTQKGFRNVSALDADAFHELLEPWIGAQTREERVCSERACERLPLRNGTFQPFKC